MATIQRPRVHTLHRVVAAANILIPYVNVFRPLGAYLDMSDLAVWSDLQAVCKVVHL